jgi:hypothetical protein
MGKMSRKPFEKNFIRSVQMEGNEKFGNFRPIFENNVKSLLIKKKKREKTVQSLKECGP